MDFIWQIALASIMAVAARMHGAAKRDEVTGALTGWPMAGRIISTAIFGLAFAYASFMTFGIWWLALIEGLVSVAAFSTGHGRVYAMTGANLNDPNPEMLEKLFGWLYRGDISKPLYSWYIMGLKGLFIGLAAAPFGIFLAVLWPLAYWASFYFKNDSAPAEWASGLFAGMVIVASLGG